VRSGPDSSVRGEFGYWVFEEGRGRAAAFVNYARRMAGIILDMFPHWQYLLESLFGSITAILPWRHAHSERVDETGATMP